MKAESKHDRGVKHEPYFSRWFSPKTCEYCSDYHKTYREWETCAAGWMMASVRHLYR